MGETHSAQTFRTEMRNQPSIVRNILPEFLHLQKEGQIFIQSNGRFVLTDCSSQPDSIMLEAPRHSLRRKCCLIHGNTLFQKAPPVTCLTLGNSACRHGLSALLAGYQCTLKTGFA
jgi:hypothetical protein